MFMEMAKFSFNEALIINPKFAKGYFLRAKIYKLFGNIVMVASILSLLMFLMGLYKGKLIGLELVSVFQISYLSLITIENLTPMYSSFSYLSYSCGLSINLLSSNANIGKQFKLLNMSEPFMNN